MPGILITCTLHIFAAHFWHALKRQIPQKEPNKLHCRQMKTLNVESVAVGPYANECYLKLRISLPWAVTQPPNFLCISSRKVQSVHLFTFWNCQCFCLDEEKISLISRLNYDAVCTKWHYKFRECTKKMSNKEFQHFYFKHKKVDGPL